MLTRSMPYAEIQLQKSIHYVNTYLIQKHPGCKKGAAKNLKKGQDEKELKSKWAAKADVVLVLMRIKF